MGPGVRGHVMTGRGPDHGWVGGRRNQEAEASGHEAKQAKASPFASADLKPVLYHYKCTSKLVNPTLWVQEGRGSAHLTLRPEYYWGLDSGCKTDLCAGASAETRTHRDDWRMLSPRIHLPHLPRCRVLPWASGGSLGHSPPRVVPRDWSFLTVHGFVPWPTQEARLLAHGNLIAPAGSPKDGTWAAAE